MPLEAEWRKVNVYGGFCRSTGARGIEVVIRDHNVVVCLAAWRDVVEAMDAEELKKSRCWALICYRKP